MSEIRIVGFKPKQEKELTYLGDIKHGTIFMDSWRRGRPQLFMKVGGTVINLHEPQFLYTDSNTAFLIDCEVDIEIKIL